MRNLLLTLRSALLLFAVLVTAPHASAYDFEVDGIYYNILTDSDPLEAIVVGGTQAYTGAVVIPSSVSYNGITYLVTTIGSRAFYGCSGLTSISLPPSIKSIGSEAFEYSGLQKIEISDIGAWCKIDFHLIKWTTIWTKYGGQVSCYIPTGGSSPLEIAGHLFLNGEEVIDLKIPENVDSISYGAFKGCQSLKSVDTGNGVKGIGGDAFSDCPQLTSITIGENVKRFGTVYVTWESWDEDIREPHSHQVCPIHRDPSLVTIKWNAVSSIESLCYNYIAYDYYIQELPIENVIIGDNVNYLPEEFLYGCYNIRSLTIPPSVTDISSEAFEQSGLTEITCLGIVPPRITFNYLVLPRDIVIYVPETALNAYCNAPGWSEYTILPISNLRRLKVNLPENVNLADYAQMRLELNSAGKTTYYIITDKRHYTFSGIGDSTECNIALYNQFGDVFGKIEGIQVNENVDTTFSSLLNPHDVTLIIKSPNGQDVTSQCKITWLDENGELLLQGNPIKRLPPGRKLKYQVTLPQELATVYTMPVENSYTVKDGGNTITCQLTAISQTQLSGRVTDESTNQPLYGATISAVQSFGDNITKTLTARTDNQGRYSLEASMVPTTLTVAANGYISQTVDCDMTSGSTSTVPDVALSPITGAVVNVNLTFTPAHLQSDPAEVQNWYSDYNNVDYEVYNKTTGRIINGVHVQYPQLILTEGANDGDMLEITASSRSDAFNPVKATVTINGQKATATFNILERGKVSAKFNKNINPQVVGTLYDANGKLVTSANYSDSALTIDNLANGSYKLVTMGKSEFFNGIYDLEQFATAGLQNGVDYTQSAVTVISGLISPVNISEVPYFDETKFYYTGEGTSFSVYQRDIVVGHYLTFRAQVDFKDQYADLVNDVQLIVDLPESCEFYENSVMIGSNLGGYSMDGNRIIIPISNVTDVVRFCAIPTVLGDFNPSAFVQFKLNGKTITQPIGKANFKAKGLSINMPSISADTTIHVNGSGYVGALVKIYDGKIQIGQTQCRADGNWSASVNLYKPYSHSYHHIHAEIVPNQQGLRSSYSLLTESKIVEYDKNAVLVTTVTQYNEQRGPTPYLITLDFLNPNQQSQHYSYDMYDNHRTFTYTISFTDNKAVSDVMLYVRTAQNHWWPLKPTYDAQQDIWVTAGEFGNAQNADLPVNVAVDYQYERKNDEEDDIDAMLEDFTNSLNEILDEIDAAYDNAEIENVFEGGDSFSFSVIPNGYDSKETYTISSIDYSRSINQIKNNLTSPLFKIINDTINIEFTLNVVENHNSIILWDHNSKKAIQIANVEIVNIDNSEQPSRIFPFIALAVNAYDLISNLANFYFDLQEMNGWENTIAQDLERQDANYEKLLNMINSLCDDGKLKIKDASIREELENQALNWWVRTHNKLTNLQQAVVEEREALWANLIVKGLVQLGLNGLSKACTGIFAAQEWCQPLLNKLDALTRGISGEQQLDAIIDLYTSRVCDLLGLDEAFDIDRPLKEIICDEHRTTLNETMNEYAEVCQTIKSHYSNCKEEEQDDYNGGPYLGPDMTFCIDPSGFVYEGVPSNRLQGVTATCYYKKTVEDMYGDEHEEVVLWDAENYGQENPLLTDENGYYRWDVPIGMWQVKYEKEGYETTYSDWLPVPPPQLDVNIGMVQMRQPEVIKARAYPQAVEFEFDKYMFPETLTAQNIKVTDEYGYDVPGTIKLLDAEVDDPLAITSIRRAPGTGLTFASRVRFNADYPFYCDEVTLRVSHRVKSYADLEMSEDYTVTLPIEYEMEKIEADSAVNILYGDSRQLTVTVVPSYASQGKTLTVRSVAPMIAATDAETYTLDNNGQAVITVHGDLPGMTSLLYGIDGYDLTAATVVNVMMESQMTVATPTASIASGSVVDKGIAVYLRCATPGATIYYTLDGSCPCDPSPARKVYDGSPIIIDGTVTIKAMATAPDLYDSEVATFVYRVGNGIKGDVNGDGEVNIADVNAVIDIILGGTVDADTRDRADVNGDGEINIADINAIIDIILNPANSMRTVVNCNDLLHLDDVTMRPGDVRTLQVTVDHATRYSAMQCDIVLPAGLTLVDAQAMGANTMRTGSVNDTTCRITNYSMSKLPFAGDSQPVMTFTVRADAALALESEITLTNVVLADATNKAWRTADCTARVNNASGINDMTATAGRVWVEKRTLCIEARHDGIARIITVNGMTRDLTVKAGITRHDMEPGIYIVVLDGHSYKIAIK